MKLSSQQLGKNTTKLITKRFKIIAALVSVLILALGSLFFLKPKFDEIQKVGVFNLQTSEEQLRLKNEIYETTRSLLNKYERLELENLERLSQMLPANRDIPAMFVQIEALAIASGLKLNNVGFASVDASAARNAAAAPQSNESGDQPATAPVVQAGGATIQKMTVTFSVSGGKGYEHLKKFLTNIESSIRLLDVQSLAYSGSGAAATDEQYQITAITYSLSQ